MKFLRRHPLATFVLRRVLLALLTLFMLATIVFVATHVLPGNVGKRILGNFADDASVKALNHQLGTDRPIPVQYFHWLGNTLRGNLGTSLKYDVPVTEKLRPALGYSGRLALLSFLLVVPISIFAGIVAALKRSTPIDRAISVGGLSAAVIPEFVWAVMLGLVCAIRFHILPYAARAPIGSSLFTQYKHLLLPALCLVAVLFGYIARITRAGVIEALDADFTRTATLKGLPTRTIIVRHVLRNALLPTIAVVATQLGYLVGGLVAVERYFNYPGFGQVLINAVTDKDYPLVQASVLLAGSIYLVATLFADVAYTLLNPRIRKAVLG